MNTKIENVQNLALMSICLWATSPLLIPSAIARNVALASFVLWAGLELFRSKSIFMRPSIPVLGVVVFMIYDVLLWYVFQDRSLVSNVQIYICFFFLLVLESRRSDVLSLRPVFWFVLLTIPVWMLTTLHGIQTYGIDTARIVVRSSDISMELMAMGVGGYGLVYTVVGLLPSMIAVLKNPKDAVFSGLPGPLARRWFLMRTVISGVLVLSVLLVLSAGYSIAVLLTIVVLLVTMIPWRRKSIMNLVILFTLGLTVLLLDSVLSDVISHLLFYAEGTPYAKKLGDLLSSFNASNSLGTVEDRTSRYLRSLNLFFESPIYGSLSIIGIGGHSAFLDEFGQKGLLFGGLYVALLVYVPIRMYLRYPGNERLTFGMMAVALLFPLVNNIPMSYGIALYVVFPVACAMLSHSGRDTRNTAMRRKGLNHV